MGVDKNTNVDYLNENSGKKLNNYVQ